MEWNKQIKNVQRNAKNSGDHGDCKFIIFMLLKIDSAFRRWFIIVLCGINVLFCFTLEALLKINQFKLNGCVLDALPFFGRLICLLSISPCTWWLARVITTKCGSSTKRNSNYGLRHRVFFGNRHISFIITRVIIYFTGTDNCQCGLVFFHFLLRKNWLTQ